MKGRIAILNAQEAEQEARSRLKDNRRINDAEFAYSPSTFAVGMRWSEDESFRVFNIYYPMYGRNEEVTDWVSVGKGRGEKDPVMNQLTLKTGDKAYYESSLGFIPCKVLSIRNWEGGVYHVTVKLTASRGEFQTYKRGEIIETHVPHVFPRACLAYRKGIAVIYHFTPIADTGIV